MDDLREFEKRLKGFRPVAPGALPEGRFRKPAWMFGAMAAAAAVVAVAVVANGLLKTVPRPKLEEPSQAALPRAKREVSLASLRRVAGDEAALVAALDAASPRLLRPVGGEGMRVR
ncbi:MAG: hypothetical protein HYY18_11760 [Planctomycetes bacterium]|nr:hypothetical protein [Planctomycetota bacterium]